MNLKFYKIREHAKLPVRVHPADAGMDLFYCSNERFKLYEDTEDFWLPSGESRVVPTGLKVEVPRGYMLEIKNKSGIASRKQLIVGACVVDPGYDGEIYVNLHNIGTATQVLESGQKVAQAVLVPVEHCGIEEVFEDNLNQGSERGPGGFGSTGEK